MVRVSVESGWGGGKHLRKRQHGQDRPELQQEGSQVCSRMCVLACVHA